MFRVIEESQTLLINSQSRDLAARSRDIIKFGFGQSPFLPPEQVMDELRSSVHHKEYSSVQGDEELRRCMADFHKAHNGLEVLPEHILIAPGSKILIFNIMMAFEKADVLIPTPSWVSYAPQAELAGHNLIKIPTSFDKRWRIDADDLQAAVKQKLHTATLLILNYPGNPDGLTYAEDELKNIAEKARHHDIYVISDEIYGLLDHRLDHRSFAAYYPERTITTTGLSKWCGAGGWRFGAAFLPDSVDADFKRALIGIGSETYSCAPTPVQRAAIAAYRSFQDIQPYLEWQVRNLHRLGTYCAERLNAAGIRVHEPQGGFYLFLDFSLHKESLQAAGINTSIELCRQLLEDTGVAILAARAFGFEDDFLGARLAYVDFDPSTDVRDFTVEQHCPKIKAGIDRMVEWISK